MEGRYEALPRCSGEALNGPRQASVFNRGETRDVRVVVRLPAVRGLDVEIGQR